MAVVYGHEQVVEELLHNGADPNLMSDVGVIKKTTKFDLIT